MYELKSCPFCRGRARLSAKDIKFGGYNGLGQRRKQYLIRAICNKCKARGAPVNTGWVYSSYCEKNSAFTGDGDKAAFRSAEYLAAEAWNRRADDG